MTMNIIHELDTQQLGDHRGAAGVTAGERVWGYPAVRRTCDHPAAPPRCGKPMRCGCKTR